MFHETPLPAARPRYHEIDSPDEHIEASRGTVSSWPVGGQIPSASGGGGLMLGDRSSTVNRVLRTRVHGSRQRYICCKPEGDQQASEPLVATAKG